MCSNKYFILNKPNNNSRNEFCKNKFETIKNIEIICWFVLVFMHEIFFPDSLKSVPVCSLTSTFQIALQLGTNSDSLPVAFFIFIRIFDTTYMTRKIFYTHLYSHKFY
jgi:hypothetical protein